jgi:Cu(I)/Ag(I) efflux system membrane fusion protein
MTESPFDRATALERPRWRPFALFGVVAFAGAGAWFFTRDVGAPTMDPAHQHGATTATASGAATMFTVDSVSLARIGVTFAMAERGPLARDVRVAARVALDETRRSVIAPKVDGWVEELFVNATGVPVRTGDPLFAIYSPMFVAAQEELIVAAGLAEAALARGDSTATAIDLLRSARRRLAYWDVPAAEIDRLIRARETSRTLVLRAPRDGVVLEKNVVAGQSLMAGEVAFAVAALDRVWVEGEVFEQDLGAARLGATAVVEALAFPGEPRRGRVTFVSPVVRAETRTATLRVELDNGDGRLKPGMLAAITLSAASGAVVHVPRSAVLVSGARTLVYVLMSDGMLEAREVRLGVATDERQAVTQGLEAGERVVRSATFLVDGESNLRAATGAMPGMAGMPGMPAPSPTPPDER